MAESIKHNGATYCGDLTKDVTHLIAAGPQGKKYQFAREWGIKVVSEEWLYQSIARRMVLDEKLYDPLTPRQERGKGAYRQLPPMPESRKRPSEERQPKDANRRKLRRTTSSRLESQNDDLWADIGPSASSASKPRTAALPTTSDGQSAAKEAKTEAHQSNASANKPRQPQRNQSQATEIAPSLPNGPFDGERIFMRGFDNQQVSKLLAHLEGGGAEMISLEMFQSLPASEKDTITILVPHNAGDSLLAEVRRLSKSQLQLVSEWWVEKCIFNKRNVSKDRVDCKPIRASPIHDFRNVKICPTSFAGIDLMHFAKAMKLAGAQYEETLTSQTSVLVCGTTSARFEGSKVPWAIQNKIPVARAAWAWACISKGSLVSCEPFLIPGQDKAVLQREIFLSAEKRPTPQATTRESSVSRRSSPPASRALREITPHNNSKPASQRSQRTDDEEEESLEHALRKAKTRSAARHQEEAENVGQQASAENASRSGADSTTHKDRLKDALAQLQRNKRDEVETASAPSDTRKHRQLGRVQSNPPSFNVSKSASEPAASFKTAEEDGEEDEEERHDTKSREASQGGFRPSQRLSYENDAAAKAREQLLKHRAGLDGSFDDKTRRRVERVGLVRDGNERRSDEAPTTRKTTRRR